MANKKYKINVKDDNAFPGIRMDDSITNSATFGRTVNDASGIDIGSMVFDGTNPHSTWTFKDSLNGAGDTATNLEDKFYYAYNPQYHGAAESSQAESETPVLVPALAAAIVPNLFIFKPFDKKINRLLFTMGIGLHHHGDGMPHEFSRGLNFRHSLTYGHE